MRLCATPRCPELVQKGHCPAHTRQKDRARGTAAERGYDWRWSQFSKRFLAGHPVCGMRADGTLHSEHSQCITEGLTTAATCTDHIVSMANGGDQYDPANLQALCARCNARKRNLVDGPNAPGRRRFQNF